jgi:hypothetical protein
MLLPSNDFDSVISWAFNLPDYKNLDIVHNYLKAVTTLEKIKSPIKSEVEEFLRSIDYRIMKKLNLDNNLFKFKKDVTEMAQLKRSEWATFFHNRYGFTGPLLDTDKTLEHMRKTAVTLRSNALVGVLDLDEQLLSITNNTPIPQTFNLRIVFEDKMGTGRTPLRKGSSISVLPNQSLTVKRKELRDEFNSPAAVLDGIQFIKFILESDGCSSTFDIGSNVIVSTSSDGRCLLQKP